MFPPHDLAETAEVILIGQYDSPFVRRVGIALTLYGLPFEHRPWSVFSDAEKVRAYNPLMRVPVLALDGEVLIETQAILDHLDRLVGPERALYPQEDADRRRALKVASLAGGISDKAVALYYETNLHAEPSQVWVERCRSQIAGALAALEAERTHRAGPWWFGEAMGHADIAVAATLRHLTEAHPGLVSPDDIPALAAHARACEALAVFRSISQPFIPPA